MINKIKKILIPITLISIAIPILILITGIFGVEIFDTNGIMLKIMISFASIAVASAFSINALNIYKVKSILSIISLSLLALSLILALIVFWTGFTTPIFFNNLCLVIAMATILFCIIVSTHIKLDKRYITLQSLTYIFIIAIDIFLTIQIFITDLFGINGLWQAFLIVCLATFALLCTLGVLGKKSNDTIDISNNKKYIKITKEEYNQLKARINELESKLDKKQN